jgi:hypothetical protein
MRQCLSYLAAINKSLPLVATPCRTRHMRTNAKAPRASESVQMIGSTHSQEGIIVENNAKYNGDY